MKYCAKTSYLGSAYRGFERQKNYPSIQGCLEQALAYLTGKTTLIHGAGRTDAGVHAKGQTFSFESETISDIPAFVYAFNRLLPKDIAILSLQEVPPDFDARHSAIGKIYSYAFHVGRKDPFAVTVAQVGLPHFSFARFIAAMKLYEGRHNFQDFTTKADDKDGFIRNLAPLRFETNEKEGYLKVTLQANGFMTYMVRILVGVAFKVAVGKMSLEDVEAHLGDAPRKILAFKAPAEGLTLEEVIYG